jgi:predicted amidophosphoribosyltransferase
VAATAIAICSNPDCTRHAAAAQAAQLPERGPTCGFVMVERCWKCERAIVDPFSAYCADCGVPLKRILPNVEAQRPVIAICSNPDCTGAIETAALAALPSRCERCHAPLVSHCWKCGTPISAADQHYCQFCGVPLKRLTTAIYNWKSPRAVTPAP